MHVLDVDLGFEPDRAAAVKVEYDDSAPNDAASTQKRTAIFQQILARVSAIPGVEAAGISDYLPLGGNRAWERLLKGIKQPDNLAAAGLRCDLDICGHGHQAAGATYLGRRPQERE
jgi:hypothetical protein